MVLPGAGYLAGVVMKEVAKMFGCSEETASNLGSAAKWGVSIVALDPSSILADSVIEIGAETVVESGSTATGTQGHESTR